MNIKTNYQVNFGALVPKAQYNGKPKLSKPAINEIKELNELLKNAKKEVIDLENDINNPDNYGLLVKYSKSRLKLVQDFIKRLQEQIDVTRQYGFFSRKPASGMQQEHQKEIEKLEEQFAKASKNPDEALLIFG